MILWDIDIKTADGRMAHEQFPVEVDAALRDEGFGPHPEIYAIYSGVVDLLAAEEPYLAELGVYCLRELRDDDEFFLALCSFEGMRPTGSAMDPATKWRRAS